MLALSLPTPLGPMTLVEESGAIVSLHWGGAPRQRETALLGTARARLLRFFAGLPEPFDLPLAPAGSPFERAVWAALRAIPWGETRTYGAIARACAAPPAAPRAVGRAVGRNPIPILIPCHRVLAANGPGGFSAPGGIATKRALLAIEGRPFETDLFGARTGAFTRPDTPTQQGEAAP